MGVDKHDTYTTDRGTTVVKSLQIFKSGTFRDSWGDQQTWTDDQIQEMVNHFHVLKSTGAFPNVPVRNDHSFSVTDIIGYFVDVRAELPYLVADVEFTDEAALAKFDNGTYRSRSIEIGLYETNEGQSYFPVVMGLAFVDIPAVEGLHSRPKNGIHSFRQESQVPDAPAQPAATTPVFTFNLGAKGTTTDFAMVQAHIAAQDAEITKLSGEKATLVAENTEWESKFAKAAEESRVAFVSQLATDNKIIGPQVEPMTALVKGMSDEQFAQFQASFSAAPTAAILTPHANAATANGSDAPGAPDPTAPLDGEDLLYEKVKQFRMAGQSDETIWKTKTGQALRNLGKTTLDK